LNITQKLTSGYHRDLQLIKPPLFRGIDSCLQTLDILPSALSGVRFQPKQYSAGPQHPRRSRRERVGDKGKRAVSRSVPAGGSEAQGPRSDASGSSPQIARCAEFCIHEKNAGPNIIGIVFTEIGDDFVLRYHARGRNALGNLTGLLHGGASVALAETLGSMGGNHVHRSIRAVSMRGSGDQRQPSYVRRATGTSQAPRVRCTWAAARQVWTIDIVNDAKDLVCVSRLTLALVRWGALRP
jgi:1,4-dihydroxy-2-naphthoyl-CoA hydrolase